MKTTVLLPAVVLLLLMFVVPPVVGADNTTPEPITSGPSLITAAPNSTAEPGTTIKPDANPGSTENPDITEEPQIAGWFAIACAAAGVLTSFIIPVLKKYAVQISKALKDPAESVNHWNAFLDAASPYIATAILSVFMAVVVIAILLSEGTKMPQWYVPFLAGYLFDATVQKIKPGKDDPV